MNKITIELRTSTHQLLFVWLYAHNTNTHMHSHSASMNSGTKKNKQFLIQKLEQTFRIVNFPFWSFVFCYCFAIAMLFIQQFDQPIRSRMHRLRNVQVKNSVHISLDLSRFMLIQKEREREMKNRIAHKYTILFNTCNLARFIFPAVNSIEWSSFGLYSTCIMLIIMALWEMCCPFRDTTTDTNEQPIHNFNVWMSWKKDRNSVFVCVFGPHFIKIINIFD